MLEILTPSIWTRADDRHFTTQNIEKPRKRVNSSPSQNPTDACLMRIGLICFCASRHCSEVKNLNCSVFVSVLGLPKKDWPARVKFNCDRDDKQKRRQHY